MIKYIGSKKLLVPRIVSAVNALGDVHSVFDVFSGTSRVGHGLKRAGFYVTANDQLTYAATIARCYVEANLNKVQQSAMTIISELNKMSPDPGYFTKTFCEDARFFHPKNGARVDAMRNAISKMGLDPVLEAVVLVSLMEAADRVDSTCGVQMAYLKKYASRALNEIELRMPDVLIGKGKALQMDGVEAAKIVKADVAYLDPPYNQHKYVGNYHIWETLVLWDNPEAYGVARKRVDVKEHSSPYNSKSTIVSALTQLFDTLKCKHFLVSFNNEGHVSKTDMIELLEKHGHVETAEIDYKRYVGAQIGIYNPSGNKVGKVSHLRNLEYLFVVSPEKKVAKRAVEAAMGLADTTGWFTTS